MPKREIQTMQPAQHLRKNMMMKATMKETPVAARSQYQLFLTSLMKSARAPWSSALEKEELMELKTEVNMLGLGTQALLSTE